MKQWWGYIEGYYGRVLSWEQRAEMLGCLRALGWNAYLYAPKEDPFHRQEWKRAYPASFWKAFGAFARGGRRRGVDVVPGLAPGLSFDYASRTDYRLLLRKSLRFLEAGAPRIALLMDDIPEQLPDRSAGRYRSLGHAHGALLQNLQADLGRRYPRMRLWFCPTVYSDQLSEEPVTANGYLRDLAQAMPREIPLMWTGPRVISANLNRRALAPIRKLFGENLILWDNFFAADYCPRRLFLGPLSGRGKELGTVTRGLLLNPTGCFETDKVLLRFSAAALQGRPAAQVWEELVREGTLPQAFRDISLFFLSPFASIRHTDLTPRKLRVYQKSLNTLLWQWKSLLQLEWYPYLHALSSDLALLERPESDERARYLECQSSLFPFIADAWKEGDEKGR